MYKGKHLDGNIHPEKPIDIIKYRDIRMVSTMIQWAKGNNSFRVMKIVQGHIKS